MPSHPRRWGSPLRYVRNLAAPMPLGEKLRLYVRNMLNRVRRVDLCCGHPGQPGC